MFLEEKLHDACGVFGIYSPDQQDVVSSTYYGLYALQHRGQESCGIAVGEAGLIRCHKDSGLVGDVFTRETLNALGKGNMALGHVRYGVNGMSERVNAQPIVVRHIKGIMALAHNGALTNAYALREKLEMKGNIFHTASDAEVISYIITQARLQADSIEQAVVRAMAKLQGAYSMVIMSPRKLIAARDPYGFRPLCIGKLGASTIFASESCALDTIGAKFVRDVKPGEVVIVDQDGVRSLTDHCNQVKRGGCVFEYIYFARPDSVIDGSSVHQARKRAGAYLALEHPVTADVVIGVPDSGIDAAVGYALQSGIPYGLGFIKNKYIGRTFIQPTQEDREDKVRIKLTAIAATVSGKRVVLVDDSIVRGTTSARIVKLLREAGATEIHMRVSSPPFLYPCHFGTDVDSQENLIAHTHTHQAICRKIGVDSLGYLPLTSCGKLCENTQGFCMGCFTGKYPYDVPKHSGQSLYERKLAGTHE